jgi:hypothetical protein
MKGNYTYEDLVEYEIAKEITEWNKTRTSITRSPTTPQMRRALDIMENSEKSAAIRRALTVLEVYQKATSADDLRKENNELKRQIHYVLQDHKEISVRYATLLMVKSKPSSLWSRIKNALFKTSRT